MPRYFRLLREFASATEEGTNQGIWQEQSKHNLEHNLEQKFSSQLKVECRCGLHQNPIGQLDFSSWFPPCNRSAKVRLPQEKNDCEVITSGLPKK